MQSTNEPSPSGIEVSVNGTPRTLETIITLIDLIVNEVGTTKGVAVSINEEIVVRSEWPTRTVKNSDRIEILSIAQGG